MKRQWLSVPKRWGQSESAGGNSSNLYMSAVSTLQQFCEGLLCDRKVECCALSCAPLYHQIIIFSHQLIMLKS